MKRILIFLSILFACHSVMLGQANLQTRLDALLKQEFLQTSEVGIVVYDLTADKQLYSYQDKKLYRPASVQKLITGITGLSKLGADYRFETSLRYTGKIERDTLFGDLYVVGGFDSEFDDIGLDSLVNIIVHSGIKTIKGNLYGDISMTDSLYWGSGWAWDDTPYSFQPYLSPLLYCKGCVEVTAHPTQKDSLARLSFIPLSSYYSVENQTVSRNPDKGKFKVTRNWLDNGNLITVSGNVSVPRKDKVNIYNSQNFFMYTLGERLRLRGIAFPDIIYAECPSDSTVSTLGSYYHTLAEVLDPMMKKSDNLSAEAVFYHLAYNDSIQKRVGSERGVKAIQSFIDSLGFDHKKYKIADGSGVSLYNYVSPELILAFLKYAYANKESVYNPLYKALPIAGIDGTLQYRMKAGNACSNIRAKTGTVTGVSSLAGYAKNSSGHMLAFVIINQNVLDTQKARLFQNKVCEVLCR